MNFEEDEDKDPDNAEFNPVETDEDLFDDDDADLIDAPLVPLEEDDDVPSEEAL